MNEVTRQDYTWFFDAYLYQAESNQMKASNWCSGLPGCVLPSPLTGYAIITNGTVRLLKAVTAFTVAHSITLALATLGFVHVPSKPVEATIALSIVFVASEILHRREGRSGIAAQAPWIVAFTFGLLHGFGFAGALSAVGLPQNHIPAALFFFNVGVEIGQIAFIAVVLTFIALVRRLPLRVPRWAELIPPYAIGSIAMLWVIQRVVAF